MGQVTIVWKMQFFLTAPISRKVRASLLQHFFLEIISDDTASIWLRKCHFLFEQILPAARQRRADSLGFVRIQQERPFTQYNGEIYSSVNHAEKITFLNFPQLLTSLPELYEDQSLCLMHVIKSTNLNFKHTKYEPDCLTHA